MNKAPLRCASVAHQHHHRSQLLPLDIFFAACAASAALSTAAAGFRTTLPIYATIIKFQNLDMFCHIFESIAGSGRRELVVEFSGTQFSWHDLASSDFLIVPATRPTSAGEAREPTGEMLGVFHPERDTQDAAFLRPTSAWETREPTGEMLGVFHPERDTQDTAFFLAKTCNSDDGGEQRAGISDWFASK